MPSASGAAVCDPFNVLLYVAVETTAANTTDANISRYLFHLKLLYGESICVFYPRSILQLKPKRVPDRRIRSRTIDTGTHRAVVLIKNVFENDRD